MANNIRYFIGNWKMFGEPKSIAILNKINKFVKSDKKLNKKYTEYETKAKLGFSNQIYGTFDAAVNERYDVKINEKVLTRIKNTL